MTITYNSIRATISPAPQRTATSELGVSLENQAIMRLQPARHGMGVRVQAGRLWLTQEGDATDYFLAAGETFETSRPGSVVVQALGETTLSLSGGE